MLSGGFLSSSTKSAGCGRRIGPDLNVPAHDEHAGAPAHFRRHVLGLSNAPVAEFRPAKPRPALQMPLNFTSLI
jgi:hypothetical protein